MSVSSAAVNVWLIEDNDAFRNALVRVIRHGEGMDCPRTFSSCEEALKALAAESPPEVILLDVGLPGMSGIEGIKHIKATAPATHVIMLTMFDDHDKVFKSICAGASGYLLKTAAPEKITEASQEVLAGRAPMNARRA